MFEKFTIIDWVCFCLIILGIILQIVAANGWAVFWSIMTLGWYTLAVANARSWTETLKHLRHAIEIIDGGSNKDG